MILQFLHTSSIYTYRLDFLTMIKGILFSYCLLTSLYIKAALDHNVSSNINIDKWFFLCVPQSSVTGQRQDACYIAIIDKEISRDVSINQKICASLITVQDNNIEEIQNFDNCQSPAFCSIDNLSEVEVYRFSCALNSEQKIYKYAIVVIFAINEDNKELSYKIEQIELHRTVSDEGLVINGSSRELDILKPRFESCKYMRSVSKNNALINNKCCDQKSDMAYLLFDNSKSNIDYDPWQDLSPQLLAHKDTPQLNNAGCNEIPDTSLLFGEPMPAILPSFISLLNNDIGPSVSVEPENNSEKLLEIQAKKDNFVSNVSACKKQDDTKHKGDKKYSCDICGVQYIALRSLRDHNMYIHTDQRPYTCKLDGCGKVFRSKDIFHRHIRKHTNPDLFCCQKCHKIFSTKQILERHILIHVGNKQHKCPMGECKKEFIEKRSLDAHMKFHNAVRNLHCELCDKVFSRKQCLIRHRLIHLGEKSFECRVCDRKFSQKYLLEQHGILQHTKKQTLLE
ncbi:MAG: C2H2-type zinc finger protein [Candidatus Endonucleobacter bathymodioli]|uniref:C2H2-type zinc finger protein n=1 Tax=Candidatus Endonucleibacter bathymodioli TaxID=539814 RepID=A0AA90NSF1_9GAMM|nr:C2H2-type zinc finger protein [Candidatus Endonucleobacter bathymodioli]